MRKLTLSLHRLALGLGETAQIQGGGVAAILCHAGHVEIADVQFAAGEGLFQSGGASVTAKGYAAATALAFVLSEGPAVEGALASEEIDVQFPCVLRLDEVAFPPGGQAYRHVHAGPGFRYLRWGALHLDADDHSFDVGPGDTWFEAANSPVRATASKDAPETRFVRCMILPVEFEGMPTIRILDPKDAARPRRQVTHRHVDQRLDGLPQSDAG